MNLAQAARIANLFTIPKAATAPRLASFDDLPPDLTEQVRQIMARVQANAIPCEPDPVVPDTLGILIEGAIWRVSIVQGGDCPRLVVLDPAMRDFAIADFMNLLPEMPVIEAPAPIITAEIKHLPDTRELLADLLAVQRQCLEELKAMKLLIGQTF